MKAVGAVRKTVFWQHNGRLSLFMGSAIVLALLVNASLAALPIGQAEATKAPVTPSMPNSALTPGAATSLTSAAICKPRFQRAVRTTVSKKVAASVFTEYHVSKKKQSKDSIDYLIPPELGGSSKLGNLWPIPTAQLAKKDAVDSGLTKSVCAGFVPLATAQSAIAAHWASITINPQKPSPTVTVQYFYASTGTLNFFRFAATVSNPGVYPVSGAVVSWTAYNSAGAIVGSFAHHSYPINALSSITYVGGSGDLSGIPARVGATITNPGRYEKSIPPTFPVTTVQLALGTFNLATNATTYIVTGNVTIGGSEPVLSADLDISITLTNSSGAIVGASFYSPTNLPKILNPGTKVAIDDTSVPATSPPTTANITAGVDPTG